MILEKVQTYLPSRTTRLIKSPKIFMADSGIAGHLAAVDDLSTDEPLRGAPFETYVYQNLTGILSARLPRAELLLWSVQGRHKLDFVLSRGGDVVAVEVKSGSRFDSGDLAGLQAFAKKTPRRGDRQQRDRDGKARRSTVRHSYRHTSLVNKPAPGRGASDVGDEGCELRVAVVPETNN